MKVAVVSPAYLPAIDFGGPVTFLRDFVESLRNTSCEATVYTTNAVGSRSFARLPDLERVNGVFVKRHRIALGVAGYWITPRLLRSLMNDDYDIIHANCARSFQLDVSAASSRLRDMPLIVSPHGGVSNYLVQGVMSSGMRTLHMLHNHALRFSLNSAHRIIAVNGHEARQLVSVGIDESRISIVPPGINFAEYSNLPRRGAFRQKHGFLDDEIVVMFLGRLHRTKGIDILIRAFAILAKEFRNMRLLLVGPNDGFLAPAMKIVEDLRLRNSVSFTGSIRGSEKVQAYVDSDIYVQPSRYEIFGMSLLEACACGKPVIASRVGGLADMVLEGVSGILVDPGNVEGFAESLRRLMANSEMAAKMGKEARNYVMRKFPVSSQRDKIVSIYKSLL